MQANEMVQNEPQTGLCLEATFASKTEEGKTPF